MQQAEDQRGRARIGLIAEPALEGAQVIERLVHHREADDGVDHVGTDADIAQHPEQQGDRVAEREQRDIQPNILEAVEEEDHPEQEQQVVVAGDHVLGAHVHERHQQHAAAFLDETLVAFGHAMGERLGRAYQQQNESQQGQ
ncbi:hypothetical protein D9M70_491880 [compost metagenome]